jgi:hypothetical protein
MTQPLHVFLDDSFAMMTGQKQTGVFAMKRACRGMNPLLVLKLCSRCCKEVQVVFMAAQCTQGGSPAQSKNTPVSPGAFTARFLPALHVFMQLAISSRKRPRGPPNTIPPPLQFADKPPTFNQHLHIQLPSAHPLQFRFTKQPSMAHTDGEVSEISADAPAHRLGLCCFNCTCTTQPLA